MRYLILFAALLASGASAQVGPFRTASVGAGHATGFKGAAGLVEVRGEIPLVSALSIEPMIGVGAEGPYNGTSYGILGEEWNWRADTRLSGSVGAVLAAHAPEAWLPGPLADAHLGLIGQMYVDGNRGDHTRYGIEVGAAVALSPSLSLGLDVQAVRFSSWSLTQAFTHQGRTDILRTSVAPIVRLGYTPRRTR